MLAPHVHSAVAYLDGAPVSVAQILLSHGIAGVYWVGSLEAARGRGHRGGRHPPRHEPRLRPRRGRTSSSRRHRWASRSTAAWATRTSTAASSASPPPPPKPRSTDADERRRGRPGRRSWAGVTSITVQPSARSRLRRAASRWRRRGAAVPLVAVVLEDDAAPPGRRGRRGRSPCRWSSHRVLADRRAEARGYEHLRGPHLPTALGPAEVATVEERAQRCGAARGRYPSARRRAIGAGRP